MSALFESPVLAAQFVDVPEGELYAKLAELKRRHYIVVGVTPAPLPAAGGHRIWYQPINVVLGLVG